MSESKKLIYAARNENLAELAETIAQISIAVSNMQQEYINGIILASSDFLLKIYDVAFLCRIYYFIMS